LRAPWGNRVTPARRKPILTRYSFHRQHRHERGLIRGLAEFEILDGLVHARGMNRQDSEHVRNLVTSDIAKYKVMLAAKD
jgi:hypothetical protein